MSEEEAFKQLAAQDQRKFLITQILPGVGEVTHVVPVMTNDGEHEQVVRIEGPWLEVGYVEGTLFIKSLVMPVQNVAKYELKAE